MGVSKSKLLFWVISLVSLLSLGCLLTSIFSTDMVHGRVNENVMAENFGEIAVGLIWGSRQYNYGYSTRDAERFTVYSEYNTSIKGVTGAVLGCLCLACVLTSLGMCFTLENAFIVPTMKWQGPTGLFLLYSGAGSCVLLSFLIYSILYAIHMKDNIDSASEPTFTPQETQCGYGYWLLLLVSVLLGTNVELVHLAKKAKQNEIEEELSTPKTGTRQ